MQDRKQRMKARRAKLGRELYAKMAERLGLNTTRPQVVIAGMYGIPAKTISRMLLGQLSSDTILCIAEERYFVWCGLSFRDGLEGVE